MKTAYRSWLVGLLFVAVPGLGRTDHQADVLYDSVYKTCRELHGDQKQQEAVLVPLMNAAADIYKVSLSSKETVQKAAWLIRTGCSVHPDAYASAITAKAIRTLGEPHKPAPTALFPNAEIVLTDCEGYFDKSDTDKKAALDRISHLVFQHYQFKNLPGYWDEHYLGNIVNNACQMFTGDYVYEIVGQLVRQTVNNPH